MFELATSVLLLAQAFTPSATAEEKAVDTVLKETETAIVTEVESEDIDHALTLEEYVREYFKDAPILAEIAYCESRFRQWNDDGVVLRGRVNKDDIGIMQINRYYHEEDALKLGLDIYTLEGNLEFAKNLYEKYGSKPWVHSSKCWKNSQIALAK